MNSSGNLSCGTIRWRVCARCGRGESRAPRPAIHQSLKRACGSGKARAGRQLQSNKKTPFVGRTATPDARSAASPIAGTVSNCTDNSGPEHSMLRHGKSPESLHSPGSRSFLPPTPCSYAEGASAQANPRGGHLEVDVAKATYSRVTAPVEAEHL